MLTVHCLEIVAEAVTPLTLDDYCGSAIRGAFFQALWGRFCTNREAPTCNACPLVEACPVSTLVAPLREEYTQQYRQDAPRPYVLIPPDIQQSCVKEDQHPRGCRVGSGSSTTYAAGESLTFGLHLLGTSVKLFPYVLRALQEMEERGIGRPVGKLQGRRGRFVIREVSAYHPYRQQERQLLWQRGSTTPRRPALTLSQQDVLDRAQQIDSEQVTLNFVTPTRLVRAKHFLRHPDFRTLLLRLAERLERLMRCYGEPQETSSIGGRAWYLQIAEQAHLIRLVEDTTSWVEVISYSSRQKQSMPISGFQGQAVYQGNLASLRELLAWGEIIGVGKSVTKGAGRYQVEKTQTEPRQSPAAATAQLDTLTHAGSLDEKEAV